jgi:hypothetical protein
MIIDGVIKATAEQVKPYFDLLHGIVQIPDSLQVLPPFGHGRRFSELPPDASYSRFDVAGKRHSLSFEIVFSWPSRFHICFHSSPASKHGSLRALLVVYGLNASSLRLDDSMDAKSICDNCPPSSFLIIELGYVEQHSYHLNNVASSPLSNRNQPLTPTSSSSCSAITEILRRHLRVIFAICIAILLICIRSPSQMPVMAMTTAQSLFHRLQIQIRPKTTL